MLSIEAVLKVHSGDRSVPMRQSSHTIDLNSKCPMTPANLSPQLLQNILASKKQHAILLNPWVCCICHKEKATSICSSILAHPNIEADCLIVTERCYLTCSAEKCVDAARKNRNEDLSKNGRGNGFRLAFRCANELLVDSRDQVECEREEWEILFLSVAHFLLAFHCNYIISMQESKCSDNDAINLIQLHNLAPSACHQRKLAPRWTT